ncbi:MAG: Na+/H+ antiporter NhaA [Bacteroidetes bacterium]|nr:Na+/H+ antiporter NhaA [Bacteroidota bacterium]
MRSDSGIVKPIQEFFKQESTSGIVLIISTIIALVIANSPWSQHYFEILHHEIEITIGEGFFSLDKSVEVWINDFLMAIFFFLIGLEIKREIMGGELSSMKAASLPISAALGGMIVPALCYVALNINGEMNGWATPMATDIAFTLGILTLMGKRVPISLKIFLTALAIVDDLGGVLVIALFYTEQIHMSSLLTAGGIFAALMLLNRLRVYKMPLYFVLGIALWLFVYQSGIHPTIAGVLLAISIPARRRFNDPTIFWHKLGVGIQLIEQEPINKSQLFLTESQSYGIDHIYKASSFAKSPVQRLEHLFHPFVAFVIMPLFALVNAGIPLKGDLIGALTGSVSLGIIAGLFIGKQIGITLFTWVAVKLKLGELPEDLNWKHIYGLACLAGVGFTMSLFISHLAFTDPVLIQQSKIGILAGSILSGIMGWLVLHQASKEKVTTVK